MNERRDTVRLVVRDAMRFSRFLDVARSSFLSHCAAVVDGMPLIAVTEHAVGDDVVYLRDTAPAVRPVLVPGRAVCLSIAEVDGIAVTPSVTDPLVNRRSAVVSGIAREVDDDQEKRRALRALVDRMLPGQWEHARRPSTGRLAECRVLALDLKASVIEVSTVDADAAATGECDERWRGTVPVVTGFAPARPAADQRDDVPAPPHVAAQSGISLRVLGQPNRGGRQHAV